MGCPECGGGGVQIIKVAHVDPGVGHGDDQVGLTETEQRQFRHLDLPIDQPVTYKIRPGDTQMNAPCGQFAGDFAGGQQHQFDAGDAVYGTGIFTRRAGLAHGNAACAEPIEGLLHQAAFGGDSDFQGHFAPTFSAATMPGRMIPPTAGIDCPCPRTAVSAS